MPSATSPPKSILKPSSNVSNGTPPPPNLSREERNRQVALHHAHLLQYRKDIEARNLDSTETLLDLPSSPSALPSEPSNADTHTLKDALRTFQPSDFDALVEERNIDHRCGYMFCPRKNRSQGSRGKYRIVTGRRDIGFKIVNPQDLARWCSDECGSMALYLRVQLSGEPAWMRDWKDEKPLELYTESEERKARGRGHEQRTPFILVTRPRSRDGDIQQRMRDLAIERGDKNNVDRVSGKVAVVVKENDQQERGAPVPPRTENNLGDAIEGYVPTGKHMSKRVSSDEEYPEDIIPTI
ncbi:MAG: hypothetical protein LQ346_000656 [Caloplaca aetnensis]|nr:MAG: hypothetical protein LQ346_000656 [Caloplaca aetnensis]